MKHSMLSSLQGSLILGLLTAALSSQSAFAISFNSFNPFSSFTTKPDWQARFKGIYVGALGGGAHLSNNPSVVQNGTLLFNVGDNSDNLFINAQGATHASNSWVAGLHAGYAFQRPFWNYFAPLWNITPSLEAEGLYFNMRQHAYAFFNNPFGIEQSFQDTVPMHIGVILFNGILQLNNCYIGNIHPYFGGGLGPAFVSVNNATSLQLDPVEPGINHFNGDRSTFVWVFAGELKGGVSVNFYQHFRAFAEYRYLHLSSSNNYEFGQTQYANHSATTPWNIGVKAMDYTMATAGLDYDF